MSIKAGARHSKQDQALIDKAKGHAGEIINSMTALGGGDDAPADDKPTADEGKTVKAISLDEQADLVEDAILRAVAAASGLPWPPADTTPVYDPASYGIEVHEDDDDEDTPYGCVEHVYADYAVWSSPDDTYFKVPYTMTPDGVAVAARDMWQAVEMDWTPKAGKARPRRQAVSQDKPLDAIDTYIVDGGAVKALGGGKVGGYLVRFSGATDPDLTGEFFTAKTYFGPRDGDGADTLFHHGIPVKSGFEDLADRLLRPLKTRRDSIGVWAETVLNLADEYEKEIHALVEAGKLGWSSGSPGHMVRKKDNGEITRWPIAEGSLTPTPAEPRNRALPLKSLLAVPPVVSTPAPSPVMVNVYYNGTTDDAAASTLVPNAPQDGGAVKTIQEKTTMEPQVSTAPVANAAVDVAAIVKQVTEETIKAYREQMEQEPAVKAAGGYAVPAVHVAKPGGKPTYDEAFKSFLHTGDAKTMESYKTALVEGTAANGGYLVPTLYSNEIITPLTNLSYLRRAGARIIQVEGTNSFRLPALTFGAAAALVTEGASYNEVEPVIAETAFVPYKYARVAKASEEVVADSRFDVWGQILAPDYVQAFAAAENTAFTTGTGSSQPQGVVTGASAGVTAAATGTVTADEIISLFYSLDYKYRPNAKWMMNDAMAAIVRKLKDTTNEYLWNPGLNGSTENMLMGKEVITNNSMTAPATGVKSIIFGDFSYYIIADWPEMTMQRLNELYAATGQIGFRAAKRFDAHLTLSAAVVYLIQA